MANIANHASDFGGCHFFFMNPLNFGVLAFPMLPAQTPLAFSRKSIGAYQVGLPNPALPSRLLALAVSARAKSRGFPE